MLGCRCSFRKKQQKLSDSNIFLLATKMEMTLFVPSDLTFSDFYDVFCASAGCGISKQIASKDISLFNSFCSMSGKFKRHKISENVTFEEMNNAVSILELQITVCRCLSILRQEKMCFFPIEESLIQPVMFDRIHFTKYFIAIVTRFVPLALPHLTN